MVPGFASNWRQGAASKLPASWRRFWGAALDLAATHALLLQMRILVAVEPVDFRRGIDCLAQMCREALAADPFSGTVFVFRGRSGTSIKLLAFDGQGYWLCQKRLSKGRFRWWPGTAGSKSAQLLAHELQVLICRGRSVRCQGASSLAFGQCGFRAE